MSENLKIIHSKLAYLALMKSDVEHSLKKMPGPLSKIKQDAIKSLSPDERETISAFTTRFANYQEHLGKTMRGIAIEEESATSPFGSILALMEKLGILTDAEKWKQVRDLRNAANHEYESNPKELFQILEKMVKSADFLSSTHDKISAFVQRAYQL